MRIDEIRYTGISRSLPSRSPRILCLRVALHVQLDTEHVYPHPHMCDGPLVYHTCLPCVWFSWIPNQTLHTLLVSCWKLANPHTTAQGAQTECSPIFRLMFLSCYTIHARLTSRQSHICSHSHMRVWPLVKHTYAVISLFSWKPNMLHTFRLSDDSQWVPCGM